MEQDIKPFNLVATLFTGESLMIPVNKARGCSQVTVRYKETDTYKLLYFVPSLNNSFNSFTLVVDPGSRNIPTSFSPTKSKYCKQLVV